MTVLFHSIRPLPKGFVVPPLDDALRERPTLWQGMPVQWSKRDVPPAVFLAMFATPGEGARCGEQTEEDHDDLTSDR